MKVKCRWFCSSGYEDRTSFLSVAAACVAVLTPHLLQLLLKKPNEPFCFNVIQKSLKTHYVFAAKNSYTMWIDTVPENEKIAHYLLTFLCFCGSWYLLSFLSSCWGKKMNTEIILCIILAHEYLLGDVICFNVHIRWALVRLRQTVTRLFCPLQCNLLVDPYQKVVY